MTEALEEHRGRARRRLRRLAMLLVFAFVVQYLALPQLAGARKALHLLGDVQPQWLVLGALLEVGAILAYAQLTRTVLPAGSRPSLQRMTAITLSTLGLSHVVPGGSAVGSSMGYRLLANSGIRGTDAGFAIATQGIGSAVILNLLLWVGLIVSIPLRGVNPLYGTAAVLGALLLGAVGGAVVLLTRGEERLSGIVCRGADRLPFLEGETVARILRRVAERLRQLAGDPRLLARAGGWALLNWLLSAASLWVFLAAFGYQMGVDGLIISYGLANVLAAIPLTPGGLGVIEGVLTASLVGFGCPRGIAVLGVVTYRLVNFWLPIPFGALAYLSLRVGQGGDEGGGADRLRKVATEADEEAPRAREWAFQRGVRIPERRRGHRRSRGSAAPMTERRRSEDEHGPEGDVDTPEDVGVAGAPETEPDGLGQAAAGSE